MLRRIIQTDSWASGHTLRKMYFRKFCILNRASWTTEEMRLMLKESQLSYRVVSVAS